MDLNFKIKAVSKYCINSWMFFVIILPLLFLSTPSYANYTHKLVSLHEPIISSDATGDKIDSSCNGMIFTENSNLIFGLEHLHSSDSGSEKSRAEQEIVYTKIPDLISGWEYIHVVVSDKGKPFVQKAKTETNNRQIIEKTANKQPVQIKQAKNTNLAFKTKPQDLYFLAKFQENNLFSNIPTYFFSVINNNKIQVVDTFFIVVAFLFVLNFIRKQNKYNFLYRGPPTL